MNVNISREQIQSFLTLARKKSFSRSAIVLNITQAAFSIRIQRLEEELQRTLLIRNKSGISLTEAGQKFLTYCEMTEEIEAEFLSDFLQEGGEIKGNISIGCFSTVGRSLVLKAFSKFLREHSQIGFSYTVKELRELPDLLLSAEADFILLDRPFQKEGVESVFLGNEEYVHISSVKHHNIPNVFLNHDFNDQMSFKYFEHFGTATQVVKRRYLDEIYSVIDGVAQGWGASILPEHLIKGDSRIKIINPRKKLPSPVYLCYRTRAYYSRPFKHALELIKKEVPKGLKQGASLN